MKKLLIILLLCLVTVGSILHLDDILVSKSLNRYYILEDYLEKSGQTYDVQIYGSCHAYTSFNPSVLVEDHGISSFNMANPSEIIPTTYLRMLERFKTDVPTVALVEIWGVNAYETYITTSSIFGDYLSYNIERLPLSAKKIEVIKKIDDLSLINDNFAFFRYKSRLSDFSLSCVDFNYSYDEAVELYSADSKWLYNEMTNRMEHYGFKKNSSAAIDNYDALQPDIADTDQLAVEQVMLDYLDMIIELCEQNNVVLIFYRAPYISTANELRKANYLEDYFHERHVAFYDMEKELTFDYTSDFIDEHHLSALGADKVTSFLVDKILPAFGS